MISDHSYSKEWILSQSKKMGNTSPEILELAFNAIGLLEQLSIHKLDFVFKGGTSLLLHFQEIKRLSTDIDIVTDTPREDLEEKLSAICSASHFTRWELDTKRSYNGRIPKAHYLLYFHSYLSGDEKYILLDVLAENPDYPEIIERLVTIPSMLNEGDSLVVKVPGLNSLLGDKLTAFAPDTIGVTYRSGKHLSMAKQLYDIDMLIDSEIDIRIVSDTFKISAELEISYLDGEEISIEDVYNDISDTAFLFAWGIFDKISDQNKLGKYKVFERGMNALNSYLPGSKRFTRLDMLIAASKAAYITSIIQAGKPEDFKLFNLQEKIEKYRFTDKPENVLNKLPRLPGGALYYLRKTYDLKE